MFLFFALMSAMAQVLYIQDLTLLSPIFRDSLSLVPCKAAEGGESHLLTSPGSLEPLSFEVTESDPKANCSLKLFPQSDPSRYIEVLTQPGGFKSFPCARNNGIEQYSFQIPSKYVCSACTLQLLVHGQSRSRFACADISVNAGKSQCRCKNQGFCVDDICQCPVGVTGELCEVTGKTESLWPLVFKFLMMVLALSVIFVTIYLYLNPQVLPENIVGFLERRASWMLRKPMDRG